MDVVAIRAAGRALVIGVVLVLALVHHVMSQRDVLDEIACKMGSTRDLERCDHGQHLEDDDQKRGRSGARSSSPLWFSDPCESSS